MFFGEPLGLHDTIHVGHPKLDEFFQLQQSQLWNEFEVDLTQDIVEMNDLSNISEANLMRESISWLWAADTIAARSISQLFMPVVSNSELEDLINVWSYFESIHARTYSHIVKQTYQNPTEALEEVSANMDVVYRSKEIIDTFDDAIANPDEQSIYLSVVALYALESIAFMSSFAVTFAIGETGKFQGITQLVKLIARDEKLHTKFGKYILSNLNPNKETLKKAKGLVDIVKQNELNWNKHLFNKHRYVMGLSRDLLDQYVEHITGPVYETLGFEVEYPKELPLPYMDTYLKSDKIQSAAQEIQLTSYNIGSILDDSAGLDLTDLEKL